MNTIKEKRDQIKQYRNTSITINLEEPMDLSSYERKTIREISNNSFSKVEQINIQFVKELSTIKKQILESLNDIYEDEYDLFIKMNAIAYFKKDENVTKVIIEISRDQINKKAFVTLKLY